MNQFSLDRKYLIWAFGVVFGAALVSAKGGASASQPTSVPTKLRRVPIAPARTLRRWVPTRPLVLKIRKLPPRRMLSWTLTRQHDVVMRGQSAFAVALLKRSLLTRKPLTNFVFSPTSLFVALSMTYAGARGETAAQMATVLGTTIPQTLLHPLMGGLIRQLQPPWVIPLRRELMRNKKAPKPPPKPPFQLFLSNALWLHQTQRFARPFLRTLVQHYQARAERVDFTKAELARAKINAQIARDTRGKIKALLGRGAISAATRLVLTNAVYFKSAWQEPFYRRYTRPRPFWVGPKKSKTVPMMHQKNWFFFKRTKMLDVLQLPYRGGALSMLILVPRKRAGLRTLLQRLSASRLERWLQHTQRTYVDLRLPKFQFQTRQKLRGLLRQLGMAQAFSDTADFSGMFQPTKKSSRTTHRFKLGEVVHQALIDVHEKGTEAAAATAVTVFLTGLPMAPPRPVKVYIDRPFLFVVRHNATQAQLFLGIVANP